MFCPLPTLSKDLSKATMSSLALLEHSNPRRLHAMSLSFFFSERLLRPMYPDQGESSHDTTKLSRLHRIQSHLIRTPCLLRRSGGQKHHDLFCFIVEPVEKSAEIKQALPVFLLSVVYCAPELKCKRTRSMSPCVSSLQKQQTT